MIRLKAIAPLRLDAQEVKRRQHRYETLGGNKFVITLVNLDSPDAPTRLDSQADIRRSEQLVYEEMLRTTAEDFDAIIPDCVLDPAVGDNFGAPVPVYGILQLTSQELHEASRRYLGVTRNQAIGDEFTRRLVDYGFADDLAGITVLDIDFCFISDHHGWAEAMLPTATQALAAGVETIVNGCSAVDIDDPKIGSVEVIDPTAMALERLARVL